MRRVLALIVIGAVLAALPAIATANDTAMGGIAGAAYPMENSDIRLDSEAIHMVVHERFAEVRVDFRFVNDGSEQTVRLGFPFAVPNEEDGQMGSEPGAFRAFVLPGSSSTARPRALRIEYEEQVEGYETTGYWVHEVDFPKGETTVRVEYLASPTVSVPVPHPGLDVPDEWAEESGDASYTYWLHTGAGWADSIGTAVARVTLSPDFVGFGESEALAQYVGWRGLADDPLAGVRFFEDESGGRDYQWVFSDFEPDAYADDGWMYDLRFGYYIPWQRADGSPIYSEAIDASSYLVLGDYQYPAFLASDGSPRTAWAEGVEGSGRGEWVTVDFNGDRDVREIRVVPGYAKTEALFYKYNRPKTLDVEFSDGTRTTLELADEPTLQRFPISASAEWARVRIGEIYRGTTRDETYLTEIDFGEHEAPMLLDYLDLVGSGGGGEPVDLPYVAASGEATFPGAISDRTRAAIKPGADEDDLDVGLMAVLIAGIAFAVGAAAGVVAAIWWKRKGTA